MGFRGQRSHLQSPNLHLLNNILIRSWPSVNNNRNWRRPSIHAISAKAWLLAYSFIVDNQRVYSSVQDSCSDHKLHDRRHSSELCVDVWRHHLCRHHHFREHHLDDCQEIQQLALLSDSILADSLYFNLLNRICCRKQIRIGHLQKRRIIHL